MSDTARTQRGRQRPRREVDDFDAAAANSEMAHKLERNTLRRRARASGLELRHSAYGYSLIGPDRKRVDDRNDLTLAEVTAHLDSAAREG
jgi:hypothetical protein